MQLQEEDINRILVNELSRVGAVGGALGGLGNGLVGSVAGGVGGALGARFAAKRLSAESHQQVVKLNLPSVDIINLLRQNFDNEEPETIETEKGSVIAFKKVTGSGFLNMNPTLLIAATEGSTVYLIAHAKEGLIKQHSAQKAVIAFAKTLQP